MSDVDVIVIGSGPQGLAAAATLACEGLTVLVLEKADRVGGAVVSAEVTLPGFVHDLYAMSMNLFVGSAFYEKHRVELQEHGLEFVVSAHPYASAFPDGTSLKVSTDEGDTLKMWRAHSSADAEGWQRLGQLYDDFTQVYFPVYSSPLPSKSITSALRALWKVRATMPPTQLLQLVLSSTRSFGDRYFTTPEAKSLAAAWGMHLDFAPDIASGALFPLLELYGNMRSGMSIVKGGAGKLPAAMTRMIEVRGGEVRVGAEVVQILTDGRKATGVQLSKGEIIRAQRGILTTTPLPNLVDSLLSKQSVPPRMSEAARTYGFGPGTFMIHLALKGPIPWLDQELSDVCYVHLAPYVDDLARTYQQAVAGILPDEPLVVVGQPSVIDPSRVPNPDQHTAWLEVRAVPSEILGDAGGDLGVTTWDEARDLFAERIIDKIEQYAPGLREQILGQVALSPLDLERVNPNLVGGDSVSGSHHQQQLFGFRPSWNLNRYATPVDGLFIAGAGTWPGAGVNCVSGPLAAERLLRDTNPSKRVLRRSR